MGALADYTPKPRIYMTYSSYLDTSYDVNCDFN